MTQKGKISVMKLNYIYILKRNEKRKSQGECRRDGEKIIDAQETAFAQVLLAQLYCQLLEGEPRGSQHTISCIKMREGPTSSFRESGFHFLFLEFPTKILILGILSQSFYNRIHYNQVLLYLESFLAFFFFNTSERVILSYMYDNVYLTTFMRP